MVHLCHGCGFFLSLAMFCTNIFFLFLQSFYFNFVCNLCRNWFACDAAVSKMFIALILCRTCTYDNKLELDAGSQTWYRDRVAASTEAARPTEFPSCCLFHKDFVEWKSSPYSSLYLCINSSWLDSKVGQFQSTGRVESKFSVIKCFLLSPPIPPTRPALNWKPSPSDLDSV